MNKLNKIYMHEYGHVLDSRRNGFGYLTNIGLPSLLSANRAKKLLYPPFSTHNYHWAEKRANRYAKQYFGKYYGVDWQKYEDYYPTN